MVRRWLGRWAAVTAGALGLTGLTGGLAEAACTPASASATAAPMLAGFGDPALYFVAPGGDFEDGSAWTRPLLGGIAAENEPWNVAGADDTRSMRLGLAASTRSPRFCVTQDEPHLRFFGRGTGALDIRVRVYTEDGDLHRSTTLRLNADLFPRWALSPIVALPTAGLPTGESALIDLTFTSLGSWQIDDVLIDPYKR